MHHLASSIVSFILSPFNWIIILLIAGFALGKPSARKACKVTALIIFLVFSNGCLLDWYAKKWQPSPANISASAQYSCGIVLGGFGSPDENNNGYFNSVSDRFIQTLKLYKLGEIKHILISGGNGKNDIKSFREGAWTRNEFITMGVPDSAIFIEDRSNNTFDNAVNAKQILDSAQLHPPYLLITSAHHIPRASLIFRNAGLPTIAYPCNFIAGKGVHGFWSLIPEPEIMSQWDLYLKEATGYLWYYFKG